MPLDDEWRAFLRQLFKFQWTVSPTVLSEDLVQELWDKSQGIIDIAVKLYVLTQMRAIRLGKKNGAEDITPELVRIVAHENLKLVQPMLAALRNKDWKALERFDDLGTLDQHIAAQLQKDWQCATGSVDLNSLADEILKRVENPEGEVASGLLAGALAANGLGGEALAQVMEAVAKARRSVSPVVVEVEKPARPKSRKRITKGDDSPADPNDIRQVKGAADRLAALAGLGVIEPA